MGWGLNTVLHFLVGYPLEVLTDKPAVAADNEENALFHLWQAELEEYQFTVIHHPSKLQRHIDSLSHQNLSTTFLVILSSSKNYIIAFHSTLLMPSFAAIDRIT